MTTPIDFGNCSQAVPHERRFNPRAKPKKSPGPGSYDIINTPTDVRDKVQNNPNLQDGLVDRSQVQQEGPRHDLAGARYLSIESFCRRPDASPQNGVPVE